MEVNLAENELALHTKARRQIPNNLTKEKNEVARRASIDLWGDLLPNAVLRSITATYNCVGMVVAARRSHVTPEHLRMVLNDDDFSRIPRNQAREGDVVVYFDGEEITHVGIIVARDFVLADESCEWVVSKWGDDGEYRHKIDEVPAVYGQPAEFWTDRKEL